MVFIFLVHRWNIPAENLTFHPSVSFPVENLVNEKKCDFLNVFKHFNKMLGPTHIVQVTFKKKFWFCVSWTNYMVYIFKEIQGDIHLLLQIIYFSHFKLRRSESNSGCRVGTLSCSPWLGSRTTKANGSDHFTLESKCLTCSFRKL